MKKGVLNLRRMLQSHQKRFKLKKLKKNQSPLPIRKGPESLNSEGKTFLRKEQKRKQIYNLLCACLKILVVAARSST